MVAKFLWKILSVVRLITFLACYFNCGIPFVTCILVVNLAHTISMGIFKFDLMQSVGFKDFW